MPVLKKRPAVGENGLYIHSSPPRILQLNSAYIKQLIRIGDVEKLEQAVINGQGKKLLGEYSADYKTRTFLKSIPALMSKISLLHDAVNSGRLEELQAILNEEPDKKKRLVFAKDEAGVGLLHKAVYYDLKNIYRWLIEKFPQTVSVRDSEGRTAYHYTPMCRDPASVQKLLRNAGADASVLDNYQHSVKYYMDHRQELELPSGQKSVVNSRKGTANREGLNFKKSNIRIWIHQRNMANLQHVMWEGHGGKLLVEHSNNPKMKKFLEAVPHIMGLIRDIHLDVQSGDLESLKNHVAPPIPSIVISAKDSNGLTPLHKAAGLDKEEIAEYILGEYPECINAIDNEGRTPLHYAALLKDDGKMMKFLIDHGADESALDNKQKTAAYYKTRHHELDAKLLNVVPDCPRSAKESAAATFDWSMLSSVPIINGIHNGVKKAEKMLGNAVDNSTAGKTEELKDENETKNGNDDVDVDNNNEENVDANNTEEHSAEVDNNGNDEDETEVKNDHSEDETEAKHDHNEEHEAEVENDNHEENDTQIENHNNEHDNSETENKNINGDNGTEVENDDVHENQTEIENNDIDDSDANVENNVESEEVENNNESEEVDDHNESEEVENHNESEELDNNNENEEVENNNNEEANTEAQDNENNNENETDHNENEEGSDDAEANNDEQEQDGVDVPNNETEENVSDTDDNDKRATFDKLQKQATIDEHDQDEPNSPEKSRSKAASPSKSRPISRVDSTTRPYSQSLEKSRSTSKTDDGKSRNNSESDGRSRSISPEKPRTRSVSPNKSPSKTRPNSKMVEFEEPVENNNKSRPESKNFEKSRPSSKADTKSRPVSEKSRPTSKHQSPGPIVDGESVIEGVVHGEEAEKMNNEGSNQHSFDTTEDIKALVDSGNMEQMASLVLNGEGDKLVGQKCDNTELQSFLDNVPVYMSKINRIHEAARNGSLRDLQAALDRRKFAIAKDAISPKGASPLHVAVIFGNTSIVRYLAGRFPETSQVTDDDGRTPLHYAAVLKDNGHYYNLLIHLGADMRIEDNFGHTPEYYRKNQEEFSHRILLKEFGAEEEEAEEILADKVPDDNVSARKDLDDEDMISVLERCYNVLQGRRGSLVSNSSAITTASVSSGHSSYLSKHCRRYIFDKVKLRLTRLDHNLYDLIWPSVKKLPSELSFRIALEQDFPLGIVAPDYYVYRVFKEFLEPIIKDYNYIDLSHELQCHPESVFDKASESNQQIEYDLDLDPSSKLIISDKPAGNGQVDMPFFATEEGRYLASSLGDPLIKGLTEVANKRPEDPIAFLAQYLYNFANNRSTLKSRGKTQESRQFIAGSPTNLDDNKSVPTSIDVVTVEPEDTEEDSAFNSTSRDEHGQSMLHFAAARGHGRNALFQLLLETEINVAYRDELYRTARDISIQANLPDNTEEIDRYVLHIATKGDTDKLVELLLDGYDHITDIVDNEDVPIIEAVSKANQPDTVSFLQSILTFEEKRERVHHAIRQGNLNEVRSLLADENDTGSGKLLAIGKNSYGRCCLHIGVLCQQEEIVDYLANTFSDTLKLGDNLERTALHYAMGVEKMEMISRVLIKAGARRVTKDLKGRQPTYYFLNKSEILRLQEEEETF